MDLKKPDIKAILEKLSFLKNNLNILIPIVIVIVAVLLFIPRWLISGSLNEQVKKGSLNKGSKLKTLSSEAVSKDQWVVEQQYQEAYAVDANAIELMESQSTMRPLLSNKVFPSPKDTSVLIFEEFGRQFMASLEEQIGKVRGRDCPTEAELKEHIPDISRVNDLYDMSDMPGLQGRQRGSSNEAQQIQDKLLDAICRERAMSSGVYINPTNVAGYTFWKEYRYDASLEEATEDCWYWQLGYWIIEDVLKTARVCNADSRNVLTAPVKRIKRIGFNRSADTYGQRGTEYSVMPYMGMTRTEEEEHVRPHYVMVLQDALTVPCTGRLSDDYVDVVHFNLVVVIRADYMLDFMNQLCSAKEHIFRGYQGQQPAERLQHNQISILESHIHSVDKKDSKHLYYRYGDDAVIELNLICEYIFVKSGYDPVKPEALKEDSN